MKKLLCLFIAILCALPLVACGMRSVTNTVSNEYVTKLRSYDSAKGEFELLSNDTKPSQTETDTDMYQLGDVNKDGSVTSVDLLILFKYIYNSNLYPIEDERLGDANRDEEITSEDVLKIFKNIYSPDLYPLDFIILNSNTLGEAYYIFEVYSFYGNTNGWNVDNRFDLYNTTGSKNYALSDRSDEEFYSLSRDFDNENNGILRLELLANLASSNGGMHLSFKDPNGDSVVSITEKNGYLTLAGETEYIFDIQVSSNPDYPNPYSIIFEVDLDKGTASAMINNSNTGFVNIADDAVISRFECGTSKLGGGYVKPLHAELCKNYLLSERFLINSDNVGNAPALWDVNGDVTLAYIGGEDERGLDRSSAMLTSAVGTTSSASRSFDAISGNIAFETFVLLPEKIDGASVALMSGENEVLKFETKNGKIVMNDVVLHDYIANVWQNLHIDANTETGTADIYINGKYKETVEFNAKYFDAVNVVNANIDSEKSSVMYFDDVVLYNLFDYVDYPSYPQVASSDDYNVGVNVCWLWRDQNSGEGWQVNSAFSELDTYLGFYDEGLRETADWELKYMAEHGIDFINACWYGPAGNLSTPIKKMAVSYSALHDGYMYAKYSDLVDFSIMWENTSQNVTNFEQFKEYIWNYWTEYYFSDTRYARLDNKAVLTVWNYANMVKAFSDGNEETTDDVSVAIEFMNQELRKMGYDGIIILIATQGTESASTYQNYAVNGVSGSYAYHYGAAGYDPEHQINANRTNYKNSLGVSHHIPTISTGFNDVARNDSRDPLITPEDHLAVCEDVKEILAQYNTGTWIDNTVMISTWNEYSEGTYIFPCEQNGFSYLENIRTAFTNDTSDHSTLDVKPTEDQIDRVTHMYPDNYTTIRWQQYEQSDEQKRLNDTTNYVTVSDLTKTLSQWGVSHGVTSFTTYSWNGYIKGTSESTDFGIKHTLSSTVNAADAPILHIQMESDTTGDIEVFFATSSTTGDSFVGERRVAGPSIKKVNEKVDYYINMASHSEWKDVITQLRIDPGNGSESTTFKIYKIELMNYPEKDSGIAEIVINHSEYDPQFYPISTVDGDYEVVGDVGRGFYSMMMLYTEWNRFTETLTVKTRDEKTIVFTVGSDKITVNGVSQSLGYIFSLRDGLPVFRIKGLCELLGYKYTVEDNRILIQSCTDTEYEMLGKRVEGLWEFDFAGFTDGWKAQNASMTVDGNGVLVLTPTNSDSAIYKEVKFNANKYSQLIIGVKYFDGLEKFNPHFYFLTTSSITWNEAEHVSATYEIPNNVKVGDTVYATFILPSCASWTGDITHIRIDAISDTQVHEIDSVQLLK